MTIRSSVPVGDELSRLTAQSPIASPAKISITSMVLDHLVHHWIHLANRLA